MQILQKLKLLKKLKIIKKLIIFKENIQYNIMIFDIDKKYRNFKLMNLLQLKWILYIQIQKKYCKNKLIYKIIEIKVNMIIKIIKLIMKIFIDL